jgi:thioredoxin 1
MTQLSHSSPELLVICLCAQWCGTCRDYRSIFDSVGAEFGGRARFVWLDIEDQADWMGSIDVENFPTLLMARDHEIRFFGVLLPHRNVLEKTVEHALQGALVSQDDPELVALVEQVRSANRSER